MGLSVPEVVSGLQTAMRYAQEQLDSLVVHTVDLEKESLLVDNYQSFDIFLSIIYKLFVKIKGKPLTYADSEIILNDESGR